ncbi:hypothetical protein AB0F17_60480 [Nonomuraea sp. NPDC026600]|uniref:hypothetical protein n=1 Tax=Nonomuraea sp. NPDC026600 TaxID=3155363 RepID=UPI0034069B3D
MIVGVLGERAAIAHCEASAAKTSSRRSTRSSSPSEAVQWSRATFRQSSAAESRRSEPGTPVYVEPYFPARRPEGTSQEEAFRWFLDTPGVPVPADRVKELADTAVRA